MSLNIMIIGYLAVMAVLCFGVAHVSTREFEKIQNPEDKDA